VSCCSDANAAPLLAASAAGLQAYVQSLATAVPGALPAGWNAVLGPAAAPLHRLPVQLDARRPRAPRDLLACAHYPTPSANFTLAPRFQAWTSRDVRSVIRRVRAHCYTDLTFAARRPVVICRHEQTSHQPPLHPTCAALHRGVRAQPCSADVSGPERVSGILRMQEGTGRQAGG
jgi:hypothetical protein